MDMQLRSYIFLKDYGLEIADWGKKKKNCACGYVDMQLWKSFLQVPEFWLYSKHNKKLRIPISVYSFSLGIVQCFCAPGYGGSGVGPLGCLPGGATAPLGPVAPPAPGVAVSPCASAPCQNGATCIPTAVSFLCQCPAGYTSQLCSVLSDPCAAGPCQNGGTCRSSGQVGGNYTELICHMF